jgi:predicted Zn-dependent protease
MPSPFFISVLKKRFDVLEERLAGDLDLGSIPPACWESLARVYEASPDSARTVAQILADVQELEELSSVVFSTPPPGWLSISPPPIWVALGQFFSSHGAAEYAVAAFQNAISNGAGNSHVLSARAALAIADIEPKEAQRLIDEAVKAAPDNGLVSAVFAHLNDEPEVVLTTNAYR